MPKLDKTKVSEQEFQQFEKIVKKFQQDKDSLTKEEIAIGFILSQK